jgi:hypothetical protein
MAKIAQLFSICSQELMMGHPSWAVSWLWAEITALRGAGRADMPAYIQHHTAENTAIFCPSCLGFLPMFVRDVEPHWSMAKIDFIYECSDCGGEVRQTVTKPECRH